MTFRAFLASLVLRAQVVYVATSLSEHVITYLLPVLIVFLLMLTRLGVRLVVTHLNLSLSALCSAGHAVRAHPHAVLLGYLGRLSPTSLSRAARLCARHVAPTATLLAGCGAVPIDRGCAYLRRHPDRRIEEMDLTTRVRHLAVSITQALDCNRVTTKPVTIGYEGVREL